MINKFLQSLIRNNNDCLTLIFFDHFQLNDWFKTTAPSKIRRSDGVGWIYVLSKSITEQDKKKLFDSVKEENTALKRDWSKISEDPNSRITFQTFEDLGSIFLQKLTQRKSKQIYKIITIFTQNDPE